MTVELIILETSDIHGNLFPINYGTNAYAHVGLGKIASLLEEEKNKSEYTVLIDNGDMIQGTPLTYHYVKSQSDKPNPVILMANAIGYDAAVLGNHEFNYGQKVLQDVIDQSNFPWLSANILDENTAKPYYEKPYIIKEFSNGLKIGILGITTPYIPNWEKPEHIEGIEFSDPVEEAKKWVAVLREEKKVDVVIVSYHGGFERDVQTGEPTETLTGENQGYQLCMEVEGIDVLLTGHQHRQIHGEKINGVIVVQPGNNGIALGKVSLQLEKNDEKWQVISGESTLIYASDAIENQELLKTIKSYEEETQGWLDQPIGKIDGNMLVENPKEVRIKDHPLIEFINKVQMESAGVTISCTALFDNQSLGFPENVTMRDIVSNYIYPNTLKVIRVSGQDIKDALEKSATYFKQYEGGDIEINPAFMEPKPQHFNYDMWEGITYLINISKPIGERIVKLSYQGKPLDLKADYEVVMNNYRASGGGEYFMFQGKPVVKEIPIDVTELIANYFTQEKVIQATVNNNWQVIHD